MVTRHAPEMDTNTVTPVPLHANWDTSEREVPREHVKLTDSGQERKQLVKVHS